MSKITDCLKNRIYYAAKDGMAVTVCALLNGLSDEDAKELLSQYVVDDDSQHCTPLIIAAKNGHDRLVKIILSKYDVDIDQEGSVKIDCYIIEGASALWCAAGAGYLSVVKTLVKAGANVNHPTSTSSTPLRAASFEGRLDIVEYLIEHGADMNVANKFNNTCLMIAAYKGHIDIVSYLLEKGADPNEKAHCGATAMHFAAECGHVDIIRELLDYGALMFKNEYNMTPLISAAERTRANVVEYLVNRLEVTLLEKIEALELLGASYANDKDYYSLEISYQYLYGTMLMRYEDPQNPVYKPSIKPIPAYDNRIECQTLEELEAIKDDQDALHLESLVIRERILGQSNPEVPHSVIFRGAVYADNARFDRCIELWLHALHLCQLNEVSVVKDLLRFAQVFSQMYHVGVSLSFNHVERVLAAAVFELERSKELLENSKPAEKAQIKEDMEMNVVTTLYILVILTKLLRSCDSKEEYRVRQLVFRLNKLGVASRHGQTMLHLCVNAETPVDNFHTSDVCKFPCSATAKLLIQCGADVNAMDKDRNTPLHIIVRYQKPISDFLTLHSIIMELTNAGAHLDTVNMKGKTPIEAATTGAAEIMLKAHTRLNLKCLAAKAVQNYNINYIGQVPISLEEFIFLHGTNTFS